MTSRQILELKEKYEAGGGNLDHLRLWAESQVEIERLKDTIKRQEALIGAFKKGFLG